MADGGENQTIKARMLAAISEMPATIWNGLAAPEGQPYNPFVSHEFLRALETSASATPESGWRPRHIVIQQGGDAIGLAPCYVKAHSFGEYVFDQQWAEAYERAGRRYYPKILCASPFTPVPGPRLISGAAATKDALSNALIEVASAVGASSAHVNFIDDSDASILARNGYLLRRGIQYHWFNRGYRTYEDFLSILASRKRKALRRERRDAVDGVDIRRISGREIGEENWAAFWRFYQDTGDRKWGRPYLTRAFFDEIAMSMTDRLMMVIAEKGGRAIAGALNFIGGDALYGRYWGRTEDHPFLHFEVCYHQAIEFAIERGLARVEAGAQGEHKIVRGYEPVATTSAHWIADADFRAAIARYLTAEHRHIEAEFGALSAMTPYRDRPAGGDGAH